ncbi:MAG: VWA domain-containing protein [Phycisphaeraceae bacterium]|nr:VWA domain-containing protein [Phycisphaeraceae bacterium]
MSIRFEQPEFLWITALTIPMAVAGLAWFGAMAGVRRWSAVMVRTLLLATLSAMLAGVSTVRTTDRLAVVAVVDVSGSVRSYVPAAPDAQGRSVGVLERVRAFLAGATDRRGPEDLVGMVVFDGQALAVAPCSTGPVTERVIDVSLAEGTDIESALRLAQGMFPADAARRLLLISDGNQTAGDALRAATAAIGGGPPVPIDSVALSYRVDGEVVVESVDAPARAAAGATITARVVVSSAAPTSGTLRLLNEGQEADINGSAPGAGLRVTLPAGRSVLLLDVPLGPGRVHRLEAVYEPDPGDAGADRIAANNRATAFTLTPGAGSVLLVDGVGRGASDGPGAVLAGTLRSEGIELEVVSPESAPADLLRMQAFDLVILQNVAAEAMPAGVNDMLVRYVTELGGGLVMVGGPESFGPGGWKGTELEAILPVRLDLPERLVMPAAAVLFIIDKSGSMNRAVLGGSRSQQDIANAGAALAIRTLDKNDLVGVIAFDSTFDVVSPLARLDDPQAVAQRVLGIDASGGTNLPPALEEAHRQMRGAEAQIKHVIVLSDGESRGRNRLVDMTASMATDGIKVSTIAVGDSADTEVMAAMAKAGRGEFYRVTDPNILPRVFLKAVRVVRQPMIREEPFTPLLQPGALLAAGLDQSTMPPLRGLVLTQPKAGRDRAESASVTYELLTPGGEPVLAHWQAGLGQVAAFTSDAHRWAEPWLAWPGYRRMWTQIARSIGRNATGRAADLTSEIRGDRLALRMEATTEQGRPMDLLDVPGAVYAPDGRRMEVRLTQTGPGVYEGDVAATVSGAYVVTLAPRTTGPGARSLPPVVGGVVRAQGAEFRSMRSDDALLARLSSLTGGRSLSLDDPAGAARLLFDRSGTVPKEARSPLWPLLLPWAMVLLLLDVATRRLAWDRLVSRQFGRSIRQQAEDALRDRSDQAARTLGSLRTAETDAAQPASALTEADARALAEEARRRRRESRLAGPVTEPKTTPTPGQSESSLLEAKRRARERFEEGDRG